MSNAQKISVSLSTDDLRWLRRRARQEKESLSAVIAEATRLLRQREAQDRLLASFGDDAIVSDAQAAEIRALWQG
jgi:hypothetical protein